MWNNAGESKWRRDDGRGRVELHGNPERDEYWHWDAWYVHPELGEVQLHRGYLSLMEAMSTVNDLVAV